MNRGYGGERCGDPMIHLCSFGASLFLFFLTRPDAGTSHSRSAEIEGDRAALSPRGCNYWALRFMRYGSVLLLREEKEGTERERKREMDGERTKKAWLCNCDSCTIGPPTCTSFSVLTDYSSHTVLEPEFMSCILPPCLCHTQI